MSKTLPSIFCLLLLSSASVAAPKITGDTTVQPGGFAMLTIDAKASVAWDVYPEPIQYAEIAGVVVFTGQPGVRYLAVATVIDFEAKTFTKVRHWVVFSGVPVPPGPTPDPPKPDPKPDPVVAGKLFVVIVEETRQAVAERGVFFADRELQAYMRDKGHKHRMVDKDVQNSDGQTPADVKRFVDDAKTKTIPMLYLVGEDGKTRRAGPMAKSPAELISLLKQYGG